MKKKQRVSKFEKNVNSPYFRSSLIYNNGIFFSPEEVLINKYLNSKEIFYVKDIDVCDELLNDSENNDILEKNEKKFEERKTSLTFSLKKNSLFMRRSIRVIPK